MSKEKSVRTHIIIEDKDHPIIQEAYQIIAENNTPPESPAHHLLHSWVKHAYVLIEIFERLGKVTITTKSRVRPDPQVNNTMMPLRKSVWKSRIEQEE